MKFALFFLLAALVAAASAQTCSVSVSQTLGSSWTSNGQAFSQWSVTIANTGSQAVTAVHLALPGDAQLDQIWNVDKASAGHYSTPSYLANGGVAASGSYQFGYIVKASVQLVITIESTSCGTAASASPSAPVVASSQPSPAASVAASPAASVAASPAASVAASPAAQTCRATVTVAARSAAAGGTWTDNGSTFQIYDITSTNSGQQAISSINLAVVLGAGNAVAQSWELNIESGRFSVPTPYGALQVGASQGAGVVVRSAQGSTAVSFTASVASVLCSGASTSPAASPSPSPIVQSPQPSPSTGCSLSVSLVARAGDTFNDANGFNQVFDITVTNTGSRAVTGAQLAVAFADANVFVGQISELARVDATHFALTAPSQYGPIQVGASARAVVIGSNRAVGTTSIAAPTFSVSSLVCQA